MKKTLKQDLNGSLDEVSRPFLRKSATVVLLILIFIIAIPIGIIDEWMVCWNEFTVDCRKGKNQDL